MSLFCVRWCMKAWSGFICLNQLKLIVEETFLTSGPSSSSPSHFLPFRRIVWEGKPKKCNDGSQPKGIHFRKIIQRQIFHILNEHTLVGSYNIQLKSSINADTFCLDLWKLVNLLISLWGRHHLSKGEWNVATCSSKMKATRIIWGSNLKIMLDKCEHFDNTETQYWLTKEIICNVFLFFFFSQVLSSVSDPKSYFWWKSVNAKFL